VNRTTALKVLGRYFDYMRARGYARGTVFTRFAIANEWLTLHPDPTTPTWRDVEQWAAARGLTPASTRGLLVNLRAFYRWARREGYVTVDPTGLVGRPPVPMRLPRPAPEQAIGRLFDIGDERLRAVVALMACAGLRCCECSRLDWCDVNLTAATVIVMGKGSRERLIDLSPDVVRALAAWRLASGPTGAVFVGASGRRMSPAAVSLFAARAFRAQGSPVTAHQLRHRCATMALQQPGVDLLAVRDLLGHSSVATTQIYTAVVPGRTAAASRGLTMPGAAKPTQVLGEQEQFPGVSRGDRYDLDRLGGSEQVGN
jgi:site-specific recombinase XerC